MICLILVRVAAVSTTESLSIINYLVTDTREFYKYLPLVSLLELLLELDP